MKKLLIYLVNFIINPILFIDFSLWGRRLRYTPFKRQQYSLLSANLSLFPVFKYGYRLTRVQAQLIAAIFEADHYVDTVIRSQPDYPERFAKVLTDSPIARLMNKLLSQLSESDRNIMHNEVRRVVELTDILDNTQPTTVDEYFDLTSYSIAIPCITKLVCLMLDEQPLSPTILRTCSEIIRIINDRTTIAKDAEEGSKNSYVIFGRENITARLQMRMAEFEKFVPQNRVDKFLHRLTKLGLILYKEKDFEI